jgi:hypothetical protein
MEYDEPMKLMKREGSLFGQLVKEYWLKEFFPLNFRKTNGV